MVQAAFALLLGTAVLWVAGEQILLLAFAVSITAIARRRFGRRAGWARAEIEELVDPLAIRKLVARELARTVPAPGRP